MKCYILHHFIQVFTVCQNTYLRSFDKSGCEETDLAEGPTKIGKIFKHFFNFDIYISGVIELKSLKEGGSNKVSPSEMGTDDPISHTKQSIKSILLNSFFQDTISDLCTSPPGRVAQSVTCLATDASLTADPGVASSIPARSHTFVEIDHEIISTVILLPSAESFKKGCCQLQAKVCARSTG